MGDRLAKRGEISALVVVVALACVATSAAADDPVSAAAEFHDRCAACHGAEGAGDGPLVGVLNRSPGDLRRLARRNGGVYPADHVAGMIDGRRMILAHGSREMPIWGRRYAVEAGEEARVRARIEALVGYIRSLQVP
jgi:mono/diheme cytochrome c family protein